MKSCFVTATLAAFAVSMPALAGPDDTAPRIVSVDPPPSLGVTDQVGLQSIQIGFDEAVTIPAGSVTAWSVNEGVIDSLVTKYDFATDTLTVTLPAVLLDDRVTVVVDAAVTDMAGNALDGEIVNPAYAALPSGDGNAGGTAVLRFNVLQGDADGNGVVDELDALIIVDAMGLCSDDELFDPEADVNRDGCVNVLDVSVYQGGLGDELPATDGEAPALVASVPAAGETVRIAAIDSMTVTLSEPIAPFTITPSALEVVAPGGVVRTPVQVELAPGNDVATFIFDLPLTTPGLHAARLSNAVADPSGELLLPYTAAWSFVLESGPARIASASPANGDVEVALTRETIIRFTAPLDEKLIGADAFVATFGGEVIPALLHVSPDATRVTLFYEEPLPASALVRVTVDGDQLVDDLGNAVDADGDGLAGGVATIDFETLSLTTLPGTRVCGRVFASELTDGGMNEPLQDVLITVDGAEDTLFATTDDQGNFCIDPAPVGTFFVHIDGKVASNGSTPEGAYYPNVGKPWTSIAGQEVNVGKRLPAARRRGDAAGRQRRRRHDGRVPAGSHRREPGARRRAGHRSGWRALRERRHDWRPGRHRTGRARSPARRAPARAGAAARHHGADRRRIRGRSCADELRRACAGRLPEPARSGHRRDAAPRRAKRTVELQPRQRALGDRRADDRQR